MNLLEKWHGTVGQKITYGKEKNPNFKEMGTWTCPGEKDASIIPRHQLVEGSKLFELSDGALLIVDQGMLSNNFLEFMFYKQNMDNPEYKYKIFKTEVAGISDYAIIGNFNITDPMPLSEILCSANHMIKADMEDSGPLFSISKDNDQENINLGYYIGEHGKLKMVFIERKKPERGKIREYHLHESDVPRDFYKINRYFLITD